jgi:SAM-dependent methyltransferase
LAVAEPPVLLSRVACALEDRLPRAVAAARRGSDLLLLAAERRRKRRLVAGALADPTVLAALRAGEGLPDGYGAGFDERLVEYPWLLAQAPFGRTLDAGSTLNHDHVLDAFQPQTDSLSIVTLAPETPSFPERGISYVYADLRELPFRDGVFDTVVCASTLEHVGMDNRGYGSPAERASDAALETARAVGELERVLAPGGRILVTVPYGTREDMGWQRQFDGEDLEALLAASRAREVSTTIFAYGPTGWQLSDRAAASTAQYHQSAHGDDLPPDHAVAARAVALCRLDY